MNPVGTPGKEKPRLPTKAFLIPEGEIYPCKVTVLPMPASLAKKERCQYICQRRCHDQGRNARNDIRVPVNLTAFVRKKGQQEPTKVHVENVSSGGLRFLADVDLQVGDHLHIRLELPQQALELSAQVRSRIPVSIGDNEATLGYGCMFLQLTGLDEESLRQYVFQRQLEMRAEQSLY